MKSVVMMCLGAFLFSSSHLFAADAQSPFSQDVKMKMNFKDMEINSIIESFAKASLKTFVVDPGVRGKISIFAAGEVGLDEAFDLMSTSLAINGYAVVERSGRYVVMASRNAQRSSIPTLTEIGNVKPERYVSLIITVKNVPVMELQNNLRVLPSKDGEMTALIDSNQLMVTDYISNLNRINEVVKTLDQPASPLAQKFAKMSREQMKAAKLPRTEK